MKKIKLKDIIAILFIISWCVFFLLFIKTTIDNQELQSTISDQNQLIKNITKNDSTHTSNTKSYSDVIKKYTTSYSIKIGKKEYTFDEFVKLYDKIEQENYKIRDSLINALEIIKVLKSATSKYDDLTKEYNKMVRKQSDSTFIYRELFDSAKKLYGFNLHIQRDSAGSFILTRENSKADSADILYRHFKNRMKETSPGHYTIDISGEPMNINVKEVKPEKGKKRSKN